MTLLSSQASPSVVWLRGELAFQGDTWGGPWDPHGAGAGLWKQLKWILTLVPMLTFWRTSGLSLPCLSLGSTEADQPPWPTFLASDKCQINVCQLSSLSQPGDSWRFLETQYCEPFWSTCCVPSILAQRGAFPSALGAPLRSSSLGKVPERRCCPGCPDCREQVNLAPRSGTRPHRGPREAILVWVRCSFSPDTERERPVQPGGGRLGPWRRVKSRGTDGDERWQWGGGGLGSGDGSLWVSLLLERPLLAHRRGSCGQFPP